MEIHVEIAEGFRSQTDSDPLKRAAEISLKYLHLHPEAALSILISDDEHLRELNHQYRQVDAPTDVLSFPHEFDHPESGAPYLGDVVISYPRAEAQAQKGDHSVEAELQLLVVHGILHLVGHDHIAPEGKERMWAAQAEILRTLGVDIFPPNAAA